MLLGIALIPQRHKKHRLMQRIRQRLRDQLIGNLVVVRRPAVLDLYLPQLLRPRKSILESVDAAVEVVLTLVEYFLRLQRLQDAFLPVDAFFRVQEG